MRAGARPAPAFSEERLENEKCKFASFSFSPLFLPPLPPSPLSTAAAAVIMIPRLFVPPQTTTVEPKFALPSLSLSPAYDKESEIITKLGELLLPVVK